MGGRRPTLPHAEIAALIQGHRVRDEFSLNALQQEEPVYQTLFELITLCRKHHPRMRPEPAHDNIPQTFFGIEQLLLRIYAGNATGEEATQMLNGLQKSPIFYRRLLTKLEALAPTAAWEETEAFAGVKMKSDEEVLALVREISQPAASQPSFGAWLWQAAVAFFVGVFQAAAQALDFLVGHRAIAVGVPLLLIAAFTLTKLQDEPFVPLLPSPPTSLRAALPETNAFRRDFKEAMSDYALKNYTKALITLESLQPVAATLYKHIDSTSHATLLRDYYFYSGISHFALSLEAQNQNEHAEQGIAWLMRADSLVQAQQMANSDREIFFLGQAYGFNGEYEKAKELLQRIESESSYFDYQKKLSSKWFNNF